ncbi:NAD-dependent epimerase/dehydratase family protein [Vibrio bathopelagicus]|uniref:NAD-dependent epimerase/dehydratase family protein n=1 Tax=Vibrio bathopelagicus TaxID=2777577 RepID=UPI001863D40C|nr:NAD(P)-dependent oxidoreductase [Vibrio bathopelagicus]
MRVLISGANGYIGRHVTKLFAESGLEVFTYGRNKRVIPLSKNVKEARSNFEGYFDVVINCARPHWSEFSADEIADIEYELLKRLDRFADKNAIKIHTSGVWLFGHASYKDLVEFSLKPLDAVKLDVETINYAIQAKWEIVYCPSLVYGGDNCQLKRIIETYSNRTVPVAMPSLGYNQYIHVYDIAKFYLLLAQQQTSEKQYFIAETKGYSPAAFAQLLLGSKVVTKVNECTWVEFEAVYGSAALDIEKLNLKLPISLLFEPTEFVGEYIEKYT